jgi:nitrous oxide reductase
VYEPGVSPASMKKSADAIAGEKEARIVRRPGAHGFAVPMKNVMVSLDPGETTTVEFTVDKPGSYSFYCTEFCSALHLEMQGWLIVEPK